MGERPRGRLWKPLRSPVQPPGVLRTLEVQGRLRRDSGLGRIYHPGAVSYRETVAENALHVVVQGDRVSAHIDRVSPVGRAKDGTARYSVWRTALHNLAGMAEEALRALGGRRPGRRCDPACEWVGVDDDLIARLLHPDDGTPELAGAALDRLRRELADGAGGVRLVPFNMVDQIVHLLDRHEDPWSVQVESHTAGRVDEGRFREALQEALRRHPMARARKAASRRTRSRDCWQIPSHVDVDALRTVECPDEAELRTVRGQLYSTAVPLAESPPLRVWLVRMPRGDVVMVNANHAAMDGFGAVRFLRSVARLYAGDTDDLPEVDPVSERDLTRLRPTSHASTRLRRHLALAERLRDLATPPARIAREPASDEPGYGFHQVRLDGAKARGLVDEDQAEKVNDVLLTALHLAVGAWNADHGLSRSGRVSVLAPANLRPSEWRDEIVGNFSLPARISTNPSQRATPARALAAVTAQTSRKKKSGVGTAFLEILSRSWLLPLWATKGMVGTIDALGDRFADTAVLWNLGHVGDAPSFGAETDDTELWFSGPARMPLGVSVGAVTAGGCLHLVFRYRYSQFCADAARRFVDSYLTQLHLVLDSVADASPSPRKATSEPRATVTEHGRPGGWRP